MGFDAFFGALSVTMVTNTVDLLGDIEPVLAVGFSVAVLGLVLGALTRFFPR